MRLSFCMIVKNEAENLARCLTSVQPIADELIVLDTGSTDDTVAIAESLGASVHHFTWANDFSAARNYALQFVSGDWVLVLDADEVLVPAAIPVLRQAMQQENALVINLIRQEVGATQSPYSLVSRLFRRHSQVYFSRPYHAMVDDSVAALRQTEPDWQVVNCAQIAILHYGYEPGAIASRNKIEKARSTMEGFLADHPNDPYVCSKLGALYVQMGDWQQGMVLLQRGLSQPTDAPICYELHYHLGIAYSQLKNYQQAELHYRSAIAQPILDSLKLGAYNNLGNLLQARGDFIHAEQLYRTCLTIDPNFAIGHYNLGMILKAMGQMEAAVAHYQTAIQLNPNYAEAYQNLGVVLLKLGNVPQSLAAFRQAIQFHKQQNNLSEAKRLQQGLAEMGFQV
ncbi:MAG: tetratricopeptide repeat protein [Leptolyngbya sp. IPPAS B-1204]|nr:tetratricopeptide repeat protein [Elainella sp. C42_A2020_010]RNJ68164.1 MAG: tetratricopeptide repeat protein [Leptolyngbya sp. IPPAS B-1204]